MKSPRIIGYFITKISKSNLKQYTNLQLKALLPSPQNALKLNLLCADFRENFSIIEEGGRRIIGVFMLGAPDEENRKILRKDARMRLIEVAISLS